MLPVNLDTNDAVAVSPSHGKAFASGPAVPADGSPGYAPACLFVNLSADGATVDGLFLNVGTAEEADFDPVTLGTNGEVRAANAVGVGDFVAASAFFSVFEGTFSMYIGGGVNANWSLSASPTAVDESITVPSGGYNKDLTANRADAWSITANGVFDLLVFRTTTNDRAVICPTALCLGDAPAAATSARRIIFKKTAIADNTATAVLTVTVPNANHAAAIKLTFLCSTGSTDAFESSRVAEGLVVLARTTGANVVAAVATLALAQIATVSGGATLSLAYDLSSITGAVGATNTFDVRVTLNDTGNLGGNQIVVIAELINAEATGVTMAPA